MAFYARRKLLKHRQEPESNTAEDLLPAHRFGVCKGLRVCRTTDQQAMSRSAKTQHQTRTFSHQTPFASLSLPHQPYQIRQSSEQRPTKITSNLQFVIATADERKAVPAKEIAKQTGSPAWRVALGNIAAGATAGCAVEAALYPIDTIKTRLQLMLKGGGFNALVKQGGAKNLYAGVWGNLVGVAPASAVFMGIYEPVKASIAARVSDRNSFLAPLGAGSAAGVAASVIRVPTEVVKQRLQSGEFTRGAANAVQTIVKTEGVRGLFAGYGSFMLRDLPFDAIEFVAYEQLKKAWTKYKGSDIRPHESAIIGALAGSITGIATTPLDVIKTRLMTQGSKRTYSGVLDCARKIGQQEGYATFLQGWQPRVMWIGLGGCVFFTALEEAKKLYAAKPQLSKVSAT